MIAVGNFLIVRVENPNSNSGIIVPGKIEEQLQIPKTGTIVSMGHTAAEKLGLTGHNVGQDVRFVPQLFRELLGNPEKDDTLELIIPSEAVLAIDLEKH